MLERRERHATDAHAFGGYSAAPTEKLHPYNVFSGIRILCDSKRVRYLVLRPGASFSQQTPRPPALYIF